MHPQFQGIKVKKGLLFMNEERQQGNTGHKETFDPVLDITTKLSRSLHFPQRTLRQIEERVITSHIR